MRRRHRRAAWLVACAVFALAAVPRARASYEEFQTLDIGREEADDENLLDHVLVRPPENWNEEWLAARNGFRSSQGCFTSGQWYIDNDLRVHVPMGETTAMELGIRDVSDDASTYGWTRLDLRFPLPHLGLWGVRFIPTFNKSQQDVAILWDTGNYTTPFQANLTFGLEDMFNKFWALRQTSVGEDAEPYEHHPYEPALSAVWRGRGPYAEVNAKWLTASRKFFDLRRDRSQRRRELLWGVKNDATLAQSVGPGTMTVRFEHVQASSYTYMEANSPGDFHLYRRRWRGEGAWSQPVGDHGRLTFRYFYQERIQIWRPPLGNGALSLIDRMPMVEGSFRLPHDFGGRAGFLRNRVTVVIDGGPLPVATWGTRVETRAFFSLQKRFGRVRLQGTECIELDREQYDVSFHHDKGFVHIQTTF